MKDTLIREKFASFYDEVDLGVFTVGVALTALLTVFLAFRSGTAATAIETTNAFLTSNFGWYFQGFVFFLAIFFLFVLFGPWGRIRLGKPDESPEFSYPAYLAMVYAATFAAGLVFWGAAETLYHYQTVPPLANAEAESAGAMVGAMQYTLFHWGISPWVGHLIIAVPLAMYVHKYDVPLKPSSVFAPFLGADNLEKGWLKIVDVVAVVAAAGGATVTVGLATQQFITGLSYNYGITVGGVGVITLITGLTVGYTASAMVGIEKGIKRLSIFNVFLLLFLLLVIFVFSPIATIFNLATEGLAGYIGNFVGMSLYVGAVGDQSWVSAWTIFYWAWWISFAPMTGIFVARISRGRTIRQVVFATMIAGTAATFPWFITVGGFALVLQHTGQVPLLSALSEHGVAVSMYPILEQLPGGELLVVLFLLLVFTFLVTTIDSATVSLAIFTTEEGTLDPSVANRFVWGLIIGLLTSLLLIIGGVQILQQFTIIAGFPIAVLGLFSFAGFLVQLEKTSPILLTREEDWDISQDLPDYLPFGSDTSEKTGESMTNEGIDMSPDED